MNLHAILDSFVLPKEQLQRRKFPSEGRRVGDRPGAAVVAIDCEMCLSTAGFEPVRLSAVDGEGSVLFDQLARPRHPVVDWHTRFTGLTEADLAEAEVGVEPLLERLFSHMSPETILVGHGLDNDLRALGFVHTRCVDTLALYDTGLGTPRQSSLRHLARRHLGRVIQQGSHDSVEDARAALELTLLRARIVAPTRREEGPGVLAEGTPDFAAVMEHFGLRSERVLNLYAFGSRVYGTANERSDHDFIGIVDLDVEVEEHLGRGGLNLALYDKRGFLRLLEGASVWALECLFLPPSLVLKEALDLAPWSRPDPALLRASVCMESGYAWSKAMRLLKEGDVYKAQKNVFHALRFLEYGVQLATGGRISDYGAANAHLAAMRADPSGDAAVYRRRFAPLLRARKRDFTRLTPYAARHGSASPGAPVVAPAVVVGPGEGSSLAVTAMLRERGLEETTRALALSVRAHPEHPSLLSLNATPESPEHPAAEECRGLLLDAARGWAVVAWPYTRFYNLDEPRAAPVDWSTARVYEKLDGSLALLYAFAGRWHVASRTQPDGGGAMGWYTLPEPIPFAKLFWEIWEKLGYRLPEDPGLCYLFELVSPRHPIVVQPREEALALHGVRDLRSLQERDPLPVARAMGWAHPQVIEGARDPDAVRALAEALDPIRAEGFVVCDAAFQRVKVKSRRYVQLSVALHGMGRRGALRLSPRQILELVREGADEEFVAYFPEHAETFQETLRAWRALCALLAASYAPIAGLDAAAFGRAADALRSVDRSFPALLFAMRKGLSAPAALRTTRIENALRMTEKLKAR